jgi:hypothetical protein
MKGAAMQDKRVWLGGGGALAVIVAAASWFLFIHPELSSAAQLRSTAADTDTQNSVLAAKNAQLAKLDSNIGGLRTKLATALNSLPPASGLSAFTREANALAVDKSVRLTSITVGAISPAGASATTVAPIASDTGDATTNGSGVGAAPAPTPVQSTASTTGVGGEYSIQITLISKGSLHHQAAFVKALENGPRRALITSTQLTAGSGRVASVDANTTMTTQLNVFSAPMSKAQLVQLKKLLTAGS